MKRFFSGLLILSFCFSPFATAQEMKSPLSPQDIKLQKVTDEANRNRELLEIWKDHVRTVTKERDDAFQQIEALKAASKNPATVPMVSTTVAHFGEIETQPLPAAAMAASRAPITLPSTVSTPTDFQGYQDTIRELRSQLDETRSANQRMQKQMMEAGNDKTLIIRDKEQAISKIESMSQQIHALQSENDSLNKRLQTTAGVSSSGAAQAMVSAYAPDNSVGSSTYLQNAYNTQSEKLKQVLREKDQVAQRADELQRKYVDLQSAYEKIKTERSQVAASPVSKMGSAISSTPSQNDFDLNYLKSQNTKLKTELEKLRVESEKTSAGQQGENEEVERLRTQNQILISQQAGSKATQEAATLQFETLQRENDDLRAQNSDLKSALTVSQKSSQSLSSTSAAFSALQAENTGLRNRLQQLQVQQAGTKASQDPMIKNLEALKKENNDLRGQAASLKAALDASRKNTQLASSQAGSIDNIKLKSQLDAMVIENKTLKARLGQESAEAQSSQQELKQALEDSQLKSVSLKSENDKLAAAVHQLKVENQTLISKSPKNSEIEMENKYLQRLYSDLIYKMKRREVALARALKQVYALKNEKRKTATAQQLYQSARLALKTDGDANQSRIRLLENDKIKTQQQIAELRANLQAANELNQKMRDKNASLARQIEQLNGNLNNAQSDKDEAATLRAQKETIQNQVSELRADLEAANQLNRKIKEKNTELASQVESVNGDLKSLQAEKETAASLRAENQKLLAEKESAQSRAESLSASLKYAQADKERSAALESEKTKISYENENLKTQLQSLKSDLRSMRSEKEAAEALRAEKLKLNAENETMKKAMVDVEREAQANEDKLNALRDRNAYLEKNQEEQQKTIDELKAGLKKSLDDIQNLKSNFQSYLESMVSSFEERQKKNPPAESNAP